MKKRFILSVGMILAAFIIFMTAELPVSAAMSKERIFNCFTFTKMISGGMNDELDSGEKPSEAFVYYYMINSGLLDKYTDKETWIATLSYSKYNSLVKECFAKYPSMKNYLTELGEYNSKTGKVQLFVGGGYGDPVYPVYVKSTNNGKTLRGVWVDAEVQTREGIEGLDYYVDEFTDELGNVEEYASQILIHVKVTLDKNNKITSYKIVSRSEAKKNLSYKITYNANGGSGKISSQTKKYDKDLTLTKSKPTLKGYTFKGWSTNPDAASAEYKSGGKYKANHSAKLYAVWANNTYKVSFYKNGGSGSMSSQSMTYNESEALKKNTFTRKGYKFVGWNTKANGKGKSYTDGKTVKNLTSTNGKTIKLYAQWKKVK